MPNFQSLCLSWRASLWHVQVCGTCNFLQ